MRTSLECSLCITLVLFTSFRCPFSDVLYSIGSSQCSSTLLDIIIKIYYSILVQSSYCLLGVCVYVCE